MKTKQARKLPDITARLLAAGYCEFNCNGRCLDCPMDVANDAVNEIIRLRHDLEKALANHNADINK